MDIKARKEELLQRGENNIVGNTILELYRAVHESLSPNDLVVSPVKGYSPYKAREFFYAAGRNGEYLIIKPEHLPFDINVRGILAVRGIGNLETQKVDFESLQEELQKTEARAYVRGKSVFLGDSQIIKSRTQNVSLGDDFDLRTVSTISAPYGKREPFMAAIDCIDLMYSEGCFMEGSQRGNSPAIKPEIKQIMDIKMEQTIRMLQDPEAGLRLFQRMLLAKEIYTGRVTEMNIRELGDHIKEQRSSNPALE